MSTKLTTGEEANRFIEKVREKYLSKSEVFNLQDKTVTENGEVKADEDYYGLDTVTVNVQPELEDKTITENGTYTSEKYGFNEVNVNVIPVMEPTTVISTGTEQTINPPSGVTGFSKVTVNPINLQDKNVVPNENIQEIIADTGYSGLNKVTVNKIDLQEKNVNPSTSSQEIIADTGYTGLKKVTVNGIETEQKTVKSTTAEQTITPTVGKYIDGITVEALELENKTVKSTTTEQTIQPTSGKDGISEITVEALNYQEKVVDPSTENQEITPDTGYDALSKVTVNGADIAVDQDLLYTYRSKSVITAEDLAGFTEIPDGMFYSDSNLISIDIPEGVKSIGEYAFSGCSRLCHVGLPSTLRSIKGYAFQNCSSLYELHIPDGCGLNGSYCIAGTKIKKIDLYYGYGGLYNASSLSGASNIESVFIKSDFVNFSYQFPINSFYELDFSGATNLTTISNKLFSNGTDRILSIYLPDSVTTLVGQVFYNCSGIEEFSLPSGITTFSGSNPFYGCSNLEKIYVRGNSSCSTANTLSGLTPSDYNNAEIIYTVSE